MDGKPYKAGHHAATLRRLLWREHLGLLPAQKLDASEDPNAQPPDVCPNDIIEGAEYEFVADPLSDRVWDMWTGNATKNTDLFRHLFRADPDDNSKCSFFPSLSFTSVNEASSILISLPNSQNLCRLRILPPQTRQIQARAPPRSFHACAGGQAETRPDQGPSSLDAVRLPEGCGDGGEGLADQCLH